MKRSTRKNGGGFLKGLQHFIIPDFIVRHVKVNVVVANIKR